ncbi:MAG: MBL fold metallo-hydrolase [Gammaproteobacteria bacterium]|nr:MBL fold metallo-hydrolase [Gammaproteobacteria bacterium]MCW8986114.1 MBL fold metallo-hydrolase [Gammaproteobacteria bacterium]MCW9029861.1 MBL fold metallo-hydrolase [Gammaproteobacteria bacterium]
MKHYSIYISIFIYFSVQQVHALEWPNIQPKKIGTHTYVIEHGPHDEDPKVSHGFHNNPGFVITDTGVVVIDTGSSYEIGKMILRKIKSVTSKPVTHIFTTHFHGDHWFANQALVEAYPDVRTIAHPKLISLLNNGEDKFWLDVFSKRLGKDFAGTKAVIPNTVAENKDYIIGGMTFQVTLFDKAHTATDLMVNVIEEKILFTGDIINNKHFSFMGHGNFKGAYEATQKALAMQPVYVVVGHGRSGKIHLLEEFEAVYHKIRSEVGKYSEQGLMDYEMKPKVVAAFDKYKHWSGFDAQIGRYVNQVYTELENEAF